MILTLILALALAIGAVFFALENPTIVTVSLFDYTVDGPLALFILLALGLGMLIGTLIMTPGRIKSSLSNTRNRKRIGSLEASLHEHQSKLAAMEKPAAPEAAAPKLPKPPQS